MSKPKRLTSPARAAASARNGARSRGPATFEGRRKMLEANTRHGFFARAALLSSEDPQSFHSLTESLFRHYQPLDEYEIRLVRNLASSIWRLERLLDLQTAELEHAIDRQAPKIDQEYAAIDAETRAALAFREFPASYSRYETALVLQQRRLLDLLHLHRLSAGNLQEHPENLLIPKEDSQKPSPPPENSASFPDAA